MVHMRMSENEFNFYILYHWFLIIYFLCESHVMKICTYVYTQPPEVLSGELLFNRAFGTYWPVNTLLFTFYLVGLD